MKGSSWIIIMGFQGFTGHQNPTLPKVTHHLQQMRMKKWQENE